MRILVSTTVVTALTLDLGGHLRGILTSHFCLVIVVLPYAYLPLTVAVMLTEPFWLGTSCRWAWGVETEYKGRCD